MYLIKVIPIIPKSKDIVIVIIENMINKLTQRHYYGNIEEYKKYIVQCSCCGTVLSFGKDDVYKEKGDDCIHHEYLDCPECKEKILLNDDDYFGY